MRSRTSRKLLGTSLVSALALASALTVAATSGPASATTSQVVVSRVVQNSEGKKYLEVDGKPFMVGHVQNAGMQETLGNRGGPFATPLPLSWTENLFEKTKDIGYDTISIILRWRDWEPTTRGVYDWTVIDKYIEYAEKYDLRIDWAFFGSNSCGGTRLTGYEQGWATFVPDYLQNKDKYWGNGIFAGVNHEPWLPDGGPHDADARFVMNSEINAVKALFDHLAVRDTTHRTVLFQVENEPNLHDRYWEGPVQKILIWNWLNAIGNAVKSSNYVVATRVNSGGAIPMYDYKSLLSLTGIDMVGDDAYSTSVPYISNLIRNYNAMGGTPLPHIAENDGNYGNHTSLQVASLVNGGYYDTWELDENNGMGMYGGDYTKWTVGTPGAMYPGTQRMSRLLPALSKINSLVAATPTYKMAGFNIDTDNPASGYNATKTVFNYQVNYTGNDVAMALSNGNNIYAVSDTATSASFKVYQQPVAVTSGHQDANGAWVTDATKTYTTNGDGSYTVSVGAREAVRIQLPAATGTVPPAPAATPYTDGINIAQYGTATASSAFNGTFPAANAIDGSTMTHYGATAGEWASAGQQSPWLKVAWTEPQRINKVVLFDRPNTSDNANSGTLTFSDGTSVAVSGIDTTGAAKTVTFPDKTVSWVTFTASGGTGGNVGLSELQAFLSSAAPRPSTLTNVSAQATATASSVFDSRYAASNVSDGIIGQNVTGEWASSAQLNPWIQLTWPTSTTLNKITFFDRPNAWDWAPGGTLTFSDGSTVTVSGIPNNGTARSISFPSKNVTWVKFQVAGGSGGNVGLSELQAWSSGATPSDALGNVAPTSTATASSQFGGAGLYLASKATDGNATSSEWAAANELNPWIKLDWTSAQTVNQVVLYDRPNTFDNANGGTLTFSDGTSVQVTGIPTNGAPRAVSFPSKTVTWVKFQVSGGSGANVGLAEFQVLPTAGPSTYRPPMADVGWWKFDELRGDKAHGSTSLYNKGIHDWHSATMTNAGTATGKIDNALNLNGTNGYALINDLANYSLPNDTVTWSTWVYANGSPAGRSILQNQGGSTTGQLGLTVNASGQLAFQVTQANGTSVTASDTTSFPTGSWQHVAVVADGTNVKLYRNGTQVASAAYDGTLKTGFNGLGIGVKPNAAGTGPDATSPGHWNGLIDDVRVYSTALNTAQLNGLVTMP